MINKLPFDVSKRVDFNVGGNQYKVGQRYTEVIIVSAKDKVYFESIAIRKSQKLIY